MRDRPKTVLTRFLSEDDAEAFDAFVRASPFAAYQQTRAWAAHAPRSRRHDFLFFLCQEGQETIGTAIVRRTRLAPGGALATVQRGPVVADPERFQPVFIALKSALRQAGMSTAIVGPRTVGAARAQAAQALARCGFRHLPTNAQALHTATGTIALDGTEAELLARFKQRGRRSIRKAAEAASVREAEEADLPQCQELLDDFHARRPDYDAAGQLDIKAQARLVAAEGGAMLVAEAQGRIVGCHSFVRQGERAIWLGMATDDDSQAPRSYLLAWEAVRRARAMGLSHYDLAGLSAGDEANGRDQFKEAFAPDREELLPAHVAPLRPFRHAIFFTLRQLYRARRKR